MAIYVVNKKSFKGEGIYVGRPSVLGNPFAIGRDGDRAEVIARYRVWLWEQVKARGKVLSLIIPERLGNMLQLCVEGILSTIRLYSGCLGSPGSIHPVCLERRKIGAGTRTSTNVEERNHA